jgi:hypothetical protein
MEANNVSKDIKKQESVKDTKRETLCMDISHNADMTKTKDKTSVLVEIAFQLSRIADAMEKKNKE